MTDRQKKYLLAIAEEGSISRAAKKLYVSQPSLSQMLINIERAYGLPLFKRSANALTLTYAGEKYMESVREIVQIEQRLNQQLGEISDAFAGKMTFGVTASKGLYILPAVLPAFRSRFPKIELEIVEGTNRMLEDDLLSRRIDLAVLNYVTPHPQLHYLPLPDEEMLIIVPQNHRFSKQIGAQVSKSGRPLLSLQQIAHEPFIYLSPNHGVRAFVDSIFTANGIHPPKALESSNNATAHALVAAEMGLTILPDNFIRFAAHERKCLHFSIAEYRYCRKVAVCYLRTPPIPRSLEHLISLISEKVHRLYGISPPAPQ